MDVAHVVAEGFEFVDGQFVACAGEDEGVGGVAGFKGAVGGDVENVLALEVVAEAGEVEGLVEEFLAVVDAFGLGLVGLTDDRGEFRRDAVEGAESTDRVGEAESKDFNLIALAEFAVHFGEFGGEDGGGGILLGEVLFAFFVVEDCHGDVAGGAIEGEDEAGDFACFEFRF